MKQYPTIIKLFLAIIIVFSFASPASASFGTEHKNAIEGIYHTLLVLIESGPIPDRNFTIDYPGGEFTLGTFADAYQMLVLSIIAFFAIFLAIVSYKLKAPTPLIFGMLFVISSFSVMFMEGLFHDVQSERPSMVLMHHDELIQPHFNTIPIFTNKSSFDFTQKSILLSRPELMPEKPADTSQDLPYTVEYENGTPVKVFNLTFQGVVREISPGVYVEGWSFNGQIPGPTIRLTEGDRVKFIAFNNHTKAHTIHWHGVHVPADQDGVPIVSQKVIQPGETFVYEFTAEPAGVFWYHCHVDDIHHIEMGLYGPLIIEPADKTIEPDTKEKIIVLSSMSMDHAHEMMAGKGPVGLGYFVQDSSPGAMSTTTNDVFTSNGKSFPLTDAIVVDHVGQKMKLIFINAGGQRTFTLHPHGHTFTVTEIDGFPLKEPYKTDVLEIAGGQRYTVEFVADNPGLWILHDHSGATTTRGYDLGGVLIPIVYNGYLTDENMKLLKVIDYYIKKARAAEDLGLLMPAPNWIISQMGGMGGMGGMKHE